MGSGNIGKVSGNIGKIENTVILDMYGYETIYVSYEDRAIYSYLQNVTLET